MMPPPSLTTRAPSWPWAKKLIILDGERENEKSELLKNKCEKGDDMIILEMRSAENEPHCSAVAHLLGTT